MIGDGEDDKMIDRAIAAGAAGFVQTRAGPAPCAFPMTGGIGAGPMAKSVDEAFSGFTGRGQPGHARAVDWPDEAEGYEPLRRALQAAFEQSAHGKGKERHANSKPFDEQPIMEIVRLFGQAGIVGHAYQIIKKAQEAGNMALRGKTDAARAEFLGVIVYAAAAYHYLGSDAFCAPEASE